MIKSTPVHTAHGYAVSVRRVGVEFELETSNAAGDVISTVQMSENDARALLDDLADEVSWAA